ncbi:hypothetical protein [Pseudonocardia lacus]|uniref:hypothetical protein n=1 Tax=Pseudonocardia lacus TaxID=2835865 RepID=UPI001BDBBB78|nr:hypothetical protein [Pseudonocardia lacus]
MAVGDPEAELRDALATGRELDLGGAAIPATALAAVLLADPPPGAPALRLRRARLSGVLRLTGAAVAVPVELRDCVFAHPPDLRMAEFSGLALTGCTVPGLRAGNLRVGADLLLADGFTATGPVNLSDAQIGGSLRLSAGRLRGADGRALFADRIVVGGTLYARRLRSDGELRLPGARITGNVDLAGADLASPTGEAVDMTGVSIEGSFLAGRHGTGTDLEFRATGRVVLTGARIGGDVVFSGARIERLPTPGPPDPDPVPDETRMPVVPGGIVDAGAALVADRVQVQGNLELDDGLSTDGTVRLPNAVVGGYLRLSGARLLGPRGAGDRGIALLGDGMDVGGDLEARDSGRGALACAGQLRLVGATVRGSASLSGITLSAPGGYALLADRLRIGGEFYLRRLVCAGTVRLQDAEIGATLDCTGARLTAPRSRSDGTVRPSLDARAATIGKDLVCAGGFSASGGVRMRGADVGKSVQFTDATLGTTADGRAVYALNAHGLSTSELIVRPAVAPAGPVRFSRAIVTTFADSALLWDAVGGVEIDGFDYSALYEPRAVDVRTRLRWVRRAMTGYAPGPYDRLAAAYQRSGNEELAQKVLMERQRRRYAEADAVERVWGWLQRWTVGFGYRPWLAAAWLVLFAALGGTWFAFNPPIPVDDGQHPVFDPWIYAADTLLPIINLGQDGYWRLAGPSQWISTALVALGWILATTAAAGAARVLKRT